MLKASPGAPGQNRSLRELTALVRALDHRVPRAQAVGVARVDAGSAQLRRWACASILAMRAEAVERERAEMRKALAVMTDDGAPVRCS